MSSHSVVVVAAVGHRRHRHAVYIGWRGAFTHTGTGGAVRGGMTGGGTNRNTPRVRVRAGVRQARAPSAVRGSFRPRRRRFSSPSPSDVVRTDFRNFRPPLPSKVRSAALLTFSEYGFFSCISGPRKDTPSSLNRTFVWPHGFLRFSFTLFFFYLYGRHFFYIHNIII